MYNYKSRSAALHPTSPTTSKSSVVGTAVDNARVLVRDNLDVLDFTAVLATDLGQICDPVGTHMVDKYLADAHLERYGYLCLLVTMTECMEWLLRWLVVPRHSEMEVALVF